MLIILSIIILAIIQEDPCPACSRPDCSWVTPFIPWGIDPIVGDVRPEIESGAMLAVRAWETHSNLAFRRVRERSSARVWITVLAASDGPLKIAAISEWPCQALHDEVAEIRLDAFDLVILNRGHLDHLLTHEFGHTLGLRHTDRESDIMFPLGTSTGAFVSGHDIRAIGSLYPRP